MARKKKKSLLGKFANWVKGSIEKFAAEGFSKKGLKKRSQAVPSFLKIRKKKKVTVKLKPKKRAAVKKLKSIKSTTAKKSKLKKQPAKVQVSVVGLKTQKKNKAKPVKFVNKSNPKKTPGVRRALLTPGVGVVAKTPGVFVGKIAHYFDKSKACAFKIDNTELKQGAMIRIVGSSTDFKMKIKSIQINRIPVPSGKTGEDIGIGVTKPVEVGDSVYLLSDKS